MHPPERGGSLASLLPRQQRRVLSLLASPLECAIETYCLMPLYRSFRKSATSRALDHPYLQGSAENLWGRGYPVADAQSLRLGSTHVRGRLDLSASS